MLKGNHDPFGEFPQMVTPTLTHKAVGNLKETTINCDFSRKNTISGSAESVGALIVISDVGHSALCN